MSHGELRRSQNTIEVFRACREDDFVCVDLEATCSSEHKQDVRKKSVVVEPARVSTWYMLGVMRVDAHFSNTAILPATVPGNAMTSNLVGLE